MGVYVHFSSSFSLVSFFSEVGVGDFGDFCCCSFVCWGSLKKQPYNLGEK